MIYHAILLFYMISYAELCIGIAYDFHANLLCHITISYAELEYLFIGIAYNFGI